MFTHIVFFKLKENTPENRAKAKDILDSMKGKISFLKGIEVGIDEVHSPRSYDVALVTRFDSREDMDKYQISDYHVNNVLKFLKPMLESSKAVDYES